MLLNYFVAVFSYIVSIKGFSCEINLYINYLWTRYFSEIKVTFVKVFLWS